MPISCAQSPSIRNLGVTCALALLLAGCSGKTMVKSDLGIRGAPDWVNKGTAVLNDKGGRLFHGVGSSSAMGDEALQRATADDRARAEVARILSTYLDVVSNDYAAATGTGANASADQTVSHEIKAVSKMNLAGSRIIGRWKDDRTSTVYSIAELDLAQVKTTLNGAGSMNADMQRYFEKNAQNVFDKLSKEKTP